jgi:3-hydroxybutyryl-CoA dehydrogenase
MGDTIESICIVGSGFMGAQLGLLCAVHRKKVIMADVSAESHKRAGEMQETELESRVSSGKINDETKQEILGRIEFVRTVDEAVQAVDLVIEAIPETLELKRKVFSALDQICLPHTIFATNSSSIRISQIEDATNRLDRVMNAHFYPPVWQRPIVELMRGTKTSDETIEKFRTFARQLEITPLIVKKEGTGFIFNRVWRAIKKETLHLVDQGVATHEDVDRAWMIVFGMPTGPFGLMDMVGLDVVRDIELVYFKESKDEKDAPPKLLMDKIENGDLGQKTGKGFYSYPNPVYQDPNWLKGGD